MCSFTFGRLIALRRRTLRVRIVLCPGCTVMRMRILGGRGRRRRPVLPVMRMGILCSRGRRRRPVLPVMSMGILCGRGRRWRSVLPVMSMGIDGRLLFWMVVRWVLVLRCFSSGRIHAEHGQEYRARG